MAANISLEEMSDDDNVFITQQPREESSGEENPLDVAVFDMDLENLMGSSVDSGVNSVGSNEGGGLVDFENMAPQNVKADNVVSYTPELEDISDDEWDVDVEGFFGSAPVHISTQGDTQARAELELGVLEKGGNGNACKATSKGMMGALKSVRPDAKSVASELLKPSRFKEPMDDAELEALRRMKFAKNSDKKTNWACKAFREWRKSVIAKVGPEFCDSEILLCDIDKPHLLQAQPLCNVLCRFITEVKKVDGSEYPPNSVKDLIMGINRYFKSEKVSWRLLNPHDPVFGDLFNVVDNVMKERVEMGMGIVKSSSAITGPMEEKMWSDGLLGESEPRQLLETVMFLVGVNCCLRGGEEHKRLRRPGFNSQFEITTDSDGVKCLVYREDPKSKTNQGGLRKKFNPPRVCHVYENPNRARCCVAIFEKYLSLLPPPGKKRELYLQPRNKVTPNCWYYDRCLGINSITPIVKKLCSAAGFENGVFRNQSLRSTGLTRLFGANTDQQTIKDYSGHRSNAVQIYKKMSDKLRRQASSIVQGRCDNINKADGAIPSKTPSVASVAKEQKVESDKEDFEEEPMKIRTPLKRKSERQEIVGNDTSQICSMISTMSGQRKYKKIKVSLEFTDSD